VANPRLHELFVKAEKQTDKRGKDDELFSSGHKITFFHLAISFCQIIFCWYDPYSLLAELRQGRLGGGPPRSEAKSKSSIYK
jgi:hypothetical protein